MARIVVLSPLPGEAVQGMFSEAGGRGDIVVEVYDGDPGPGLVEAVRGADVIIGDFTFRLPIDAAVAEAARGCRLIQQPSIGYQHIDIEATRRVGIPVANVGAANAVGVAEHAIMFMLCLLKRALYFHARTARGEWGQSDIFTLGMYELQGKTLGIIGMGNIGREVARRARSFGCSILYHDTRALPAEEERELGVEYAGLEDLLRASDIVTLHVPLTGETHHLIDRDRLALMKPGAYLLNLARGEVVDEEALAEALDEGRLAGAGLDVFGEEPVNPANPLLRSDKVILSPHVAGGTNESRVRMLQVTLDNVTRVLSGEKPRFVVNGVT
ncbi:MAG: hydroxyacid dehydrogenase [Actinobacteria bacterium]|nr:hydroxyacid dehydrogenase [Actinomycetota bacterium]